MINLTIVIVFKMDTQQKINLILNNLQESINEQNIGKIIDETNTLKIYWGTATTGKPHLGYFVPLLKIVDFLKAGCEVTILFADLHGYLDNMKSTMEQLEYRIEYYLIIIGAMLQSIGISPDDEKLKFIKGSTFQLSEEYTMDMYKMSALVTSNQVLKAGTEVVKQSNNPLMSNLLYPILQSLDEEYLHADVQLGGIDQRKIFTFAHDYLPKLGYKQRIHLMNPLIPGLGKNGKMSSSEPNSKIDFDDSDDVIRSKIMKAFSIDGESNNNSLLAILKYILLPKIVYENRSFIVKYDDQIVNYNDYTQIESDFNSKKLGSKLLKESIIPELINLVSPIRTFIENNKELLKKAYD